MFGLFSKKNFFVGVDFGTSAIKVVELSIENERILLSNYGWIDLGFSVSRLGNGGNSTEADSQNEQLKTYLRQLVVRMKLKSKTVFASLPGFSGLITTMEFPNLKEKELEEAIQFEARKYIPIPAEEVILDWEIVSQAAEKELKLMMDKSRNEVPAIPQKIQVLLVAASKQDINSCGAIIKSAGLGIKSMELETFSLVRSLIGDDLGTFLIVDIGARATNIILVEKGIIKVNRNIDLGGNEITRFIAEGMKISIQRADALKKEKRSILNDGQISLIIHSLEMIVNEALRILNAYKEKNKEARIDGVILSGGTAKLVGIDQYFSKMLNTRALVGNPWRKVSFKPELESKIKEMGTSFSVALGLAMRGVDEYKRK